MAERDRTVSSQPITIEVGELEDFEQEDFDQYQDQFQHALILPVKVLSDQLGIAPYSYVEVSPSGAGWEDAKTVYALPFAGGFESGPGKPTGLLKGSYQERIFEQRTAGSRHIDIRPHTTARPAGDKSDLLTPVRLPVENDTGLSTCYMNKGELEESEFDDGDTVELYNPMNGNRVNLVAEGMGRLQRGTVAVANVNRDSLRVISIDERSKPGWGETLGVRKPTEAKFPELTPLDRFSRWCWSKFVGYNRINLEVRPGLDIDEERRIVRVEPDTRNLLGIENGDRIVVEWGGKEHNVKCLDLPDSLDVDGESATSDELSQVEDEIENGKNQSTSILSGNHSSNHIYMPSTERKAVNACIEDLVKVRRDMQYTMGKQVSISILGILGAFIAGGSILREARSGVAAILPASLPVRLVTIVSNFGSALLFGVGSLFLVWILMYPKRQECKI
jgi:hypothetical protein